mmetsp:Transcript_21566/g.66488  ORF Transcript_21566/g.66488 Transcript_21566/m.66488 type:complete len:87 (+) Transcript_21566:720-980(+)
MSRVLRTLLAHTLLEKESALDPATLETPCVSFRSERRKVVLLVTICLQLAGLGGALAASLPRRATSNFTLCMTTVACKDNNNKYNT